MVGPSAAGASSQPMRQPVIAQFFDIVWTNRILSSGSMRSRNDGARPPDAEGNIDGAATDRPAGDRPGSCIRLLHGAARTGAFGPVRRPRPVHDTHAIGPEGHEEWQAFVRDTEGNTIGLIAFQKP